MGFWMEESRRKEWGSDIGTGEGAEGDKALLDEASEEEEEVQTPTQ